MWQHWQFNIGDLSAITINTCLYIAIVYLHTNRGDFLHKKSDKCRKWGV